MKKASPITPSQHEAKLQRNIYAFVFTVETLNKLSKKREKHPLTIEERKAILELLRK